MNELQKDHQAGHAGSGYVPDQETQEHIFHHRAVNKAIPYIVAALVSSVGLAGSYFFGTIWSITSRLDRECPIVHKDLDTLRDAIVGLREELSEYPRNYEIRRAIEQTEEASIYRSADGVAMEEMRRQLLELRADVKGWHSPYSGQKNGG